MSDIMKQIQELQEKFDNLFEVDGLGQPAVDVPPSQNKIKKDRKTKDGKVELVSVEDELFPYEGDKREQYRQKIIATINAMIQGQATLEDLLQLTRQKKAPLKEAMELVENILSELFDRPDLLNDIDDTLGAPVKKTVKKVVNSVVAPKKVNNSLKEAMEVLEALICEWGKDGYSNKVDKHLDNQLDNVPKKEGTNSPDENSLEYQNYMRDKVAADKASSEVWNQTRQRAEQNKANYDPNSKLRRAQAIMRAQLRKEGNK